MGICKCKKRSDDFCFQHKKFICDHCIVTDHPVCYIRSYIDWLTDSEFEESLCGVCKGNLANDSENSIRLCCYHLYHPECIDVYAATLPDSTSMFGYPCPKCNAPILPESNNESTLANTIRTKFSMSMWAENILNPDGTKFIKTNHNTNNNNSTAYYHGGNNTTNGGATASLSPSDSFYTNHEIKSNSPIHPSLLEETPPLAHLNSNPFGMASSRKPHPEDTIIQLNTKYDSTSKTYDEDYNDKYNKKQPLSFYITRLKEARPIYLIILVLITILFLYLVFKMKSTNSDSNQGGGTNKSPVDEPARFNEE
ncbi:hypothetical protein CYY_007448 [Polysphondylium violaceum]|uniref:RING-type domain-containing protein n=1 Tax=Polysphondylium violaceum TaxID=133409 RepID=A0A8J4PXB2_9MYCE|nr:hypothetical protein CYY_007448 [Polysphondylium violaceum]